MSCFGIDESNEVEDLGKQLLLTKDSRRLITKNRMVEEQGSGDMQARRFDPDIGG